MFKRIATSTLIVGALMSIVPSLASAQEFRPVTVLLATDTSIGSATSGFAATLTGSAAGTVTNGAQR